MRRNKFLVSGLAVAFIALTACQSGSSEKTTGHEDHEGHEHETSASAPAVSSPEFKDPKIKEVYEHYIHLKTALVKSDAKEAQSGASMLSSALTKAGNAKAAEIAGKIASASELKAQRNELDVLTAEVEQLVKASGLSSGTVYKQYCPMAKDGDGAYWLASESSIRNPYYGDEMLECGEVKEEIK